ncbi:MAG: hypothetical protein KJ882_13815, partial [Proteobacteria bacterium]|nr:hypothetical protein [Pseudomonadota bacterium]
WLGQIAPEEFLSRVVDFANQFWQGQLEIGSVDFSTFEGKNNKGVVKVGDKELAIQADTATQVKTVKEAIEKIKPESTNGFARVVVDSSLSGVPFKKDTGTLYVNPVYMPIIEGVLKAGLNGKDGVVGQVRGFTPYLLSSNGNLQGTELGKIAHGLNNGSTWRQRTRLMQQLIDSIQASNNDTGRKLPRLSKWWKAVKLARNVNQMPKVLSSPTAKVEAALVPEPVAVAASAATVSAEQPAPALGTDQKAPQKEVKPVTAEIQKPVRGQKQRTVTINGQEITISSVRVKDAEGRWVFVWRATKASRIDLLKKELYTKGEFTVDNYEQLLESRLSEYGRLNYSTILGDLNGLVEKGELGKRKENKQEGKYNIRYNVYFTKPTAEQAAELPRPDSNPVGDMPGAKTPTPAAVPLPSTLPAPQSMPNPTPFVPANIISSVRPLDGGVVLAFIYPGDIVEQVANLQAHPIHGPPASRPIGELISIDGIVYVYLYCSDANARNGSGAGPTGGGADSDGSEVSAGAGKGGVRVPPELENPVNPKGSRGLPNKKPVREGQGAESAPERAALPVGSETTGPLSKVNQEPLAAAGKDKKVVVVFIGNGIKPQAGWLNEQGLILTHKGRDPPEGGLFVSKILPKLTSLIQNSKVKIINLIHFRARGASSDTSRRDSDPSGALIIIIGKIKGAVEAVIRFLKEAKYSQEQFAKTAPQQLDSEAVRTGVKFETEDSTGSLPTQETTPTTQTAPQQLDS